MENNIHPLPFPQLLDELLAFSRKMSPEPTITGMRRFILVCRLLKPLKNTTVIHLALQYIYNPYADVLGLLVKSIGLARFHQLYRIKKIR